MSRARQQDGATQRCTPRAVIALPRNHPINKHAVWTDDATTLRSMSRLLLTRGQSISWWGLECLHVALLVMPPMEGFGPQH